MRAVIEAAHATPDQNVDINDELTLEQLMNLSMEPDQVRKRA
jgi:hypothetical protein